MSNPRTSLGRAGEDLAAAYLLQRGYTIRQRNWRAPRLGEIDIVAQEGDVLTLVEVRTRRGNVYGTPEESLTPAKQQRMALLAECYCQQHQADLPAGGVRIDVVAVEMTAAGRLVRIALIQNAVGG